MDDEKIVLIKGDSSSWYEQVIFIIKKNIEDSVVDAVDFEDEVEKIIYDNKMNMEKERLKLMNRNEGSNTDTMVRYRESSRFDVFLNMTMLVGCILITGLLLIGS